MKKVNLLNRTEMKSVFGGVVDYCQNAHTNIVCRDPYFNVYYITFGLGCSNVSIANACGWGADCASLGRDYDCWTYATTSCDCDVS